MRADLLRPFAVFALAVPFAAAVAAQAAPPRPAPKPDAAREARMAWWRDARFGMFIHWGLYAQPAGTWKGRTYGGASEWLISTAQIPIAEWEPLQKTFDPVRYDPRAWARLARAAGMKYVVITSKHHEGFALWDSALTTWDVGGTPYRKDLLRPLMDACRAEGLRVGFYYSILDWHHPDYLPRRGWDPRPGVPADFPRYVEFMHGQVRELLTGFGPIDVLWFDGEWENTWTRELGQDLERLARRLQPNVIVNNRVGPGRGGPEALGDFGTPEQEIPGAADARDWESCMTMNGSWGFHAGDENWKSPATLIQNLVDCVSKGGNYLLNVGPTAEGEIPLASVARLRDVGAWLGRHGEAVYGAGAGPFPRALPWGRVTRRGDALYAVVFDPGVESVELTGLRGTFGRPRGVGDLATAEVTLVAEAGGYRLGLPVVDGSDLPRVVRLPFRGAPRVETPPIRPDADGFLNLTADRAEVRGDSPRYESDKQAIGFWTKASDALEWTVEIPRAGTFDVELEVACEPAAAGSTFTFGGTRRTVRGTVPDTGGWSTFRWIRPGALELAAGRQTLRLQPVEKPGAAVMNLRAVRLVRR